MVGEAEGASVVGAAEGVALGAWEVGVRVVGAHVVGLTVGAVGATVVGLAVVGVPVGARVVGLLVVGLFVGAAEVGVAVSDAHRHHALSEANWSHLSETPVTRALQKTRPRERAKAGVRTCGGRRGGGCCAGRQGRSRRGG